MPLFILHFLTFFTTEEFNDLKAEQLEDQRQSHYSFLIFDNYMVNFNCHVEKEARAPHV